MIRRLLLAIVMMALCVAGVAESGVTQADKAKFNNYGSIELFTNVLSIMKKSYVSDVATSQYINAALAGIENTCGETYPKPAVGEKTPKSEKTDYEYNELFADALSVCKRNHPEVPLQTIIYSAITSMIASVDPDGSFISPEFYNESISEEKKSLGGAGIEISKKHGLISVITPIDNSPAFKAGIRKGDQIQRIDDRFTKDLNLSEAVKLLRGPVGSNVTLTIMREGFEQPQEFSLVREVIQIKSVDSKTLDKGFGYIRITRFTEKTYDDLRAALDTLREENSGNLRGLVLDLRNNPGGLLDQAIKVAEHFLEPGKVIAYTEGREKTSNMKFTARSGVKESHILIVVLVNDGSAAGSEIVAGALQDNNRALIMGTKSFGRDSVQTIIPLSDKSGLRLTTARHFSPKMKSFSPNGVTPDIIDSVVDEQLIKNALILLKRQNEEKLQ